MLARGGFHFFMHFWSFLVILVFRHRYFQDPCSDWKAAKQAMQQLKQAPSAFAALLKHFIAWALLAHRTPRHISRSLMSWRTAVALERFGALFETLCHRHTMIQTFCDIRMIFRYIDSRYIQCLWLNNIFMRLATVSNMSPTPPVSRVPFAGLSCLGRSLQRPTTRYAGDLACAISLNEQDNIYI